MNIRLSSTEKILGGASPTVCPLLKAGPHELIPHTIFLRPKTRVLINMRQSERESEETRSQKNDAYTPFTVSANFDPLICLLLLVRSGFNSFGICFFRLQNLFTKASNIRTKSALPCPPSCLWRNPQKIWCKRELYRMEGSNWLFFFAIGSTKFNNNLADMVCIVKGKLWSWIFREYM